MGIDCFLGDLRIVLFIPHNLNVIWCWVLLKTYLLLSDFDLPAEVTGFAIILSLALRSNISECQANSLKRPFCTGSACKTKIAFFMVRATISFFPAFATLCLFIADRALALIRVVAFSAIKPISYTILAVHADLGVELSVDLALCLEVLPLVDGSELQLIWNPRVLISINHALFFWVLAFQNSDVRNRVILAVLVTYLWSGVIHPR